jgi:hypothetical protein
MRKLIAGPVSAVAAIAAVTACSTTTTVVRTPAPKPAVAKTVTAKPTPAVIKTVKPKPVVAKKTTQAPKPAPTTQTPAPAASKPAPAPAATTAAPAPGYLGDIFGGGTGNPCNFASGYQAGDCNPEGETEQQYIANPGGPAPSTTTNAQGCYYVKMGEGYCPSTGTYVPMQDPNQPAASSAPSQAPNGSGNCADEIDDGAADPSCPAYSQPGGSGYSGYVGNAGH